jgi:nucleotide-binding universal stress UspA family protein
MCASVLKNPPTREEGIQVMRILVPLDIVHPADGTVDALASLIDLKQAEVRLLYVREALPSYEAVIGAEADFNDDWNHKVESQARAFLTKVQEQLKPLVGQISQEIVSGSPAMMIETVARDEKCDITALTPGHKNVVEKFFVGSVTSKVVKHGPGTILICRPSRTIDQNQNVIIGVDGSENGKYAIRRALEQFNLRQDNVRITLVHAVDVADALKMVSPAEFIGQVVNNLLLEGETYLADAKRVLAENGVQKTDVVMKEGDPTSIIVETAKALPANLIITGAQGHSAIQHFLLGSVSHRIAVGAPCTVAVIKPEKAK